MRESGILIVALIYVLLVGCHDMNRTRTVRAGDMWEPLHKPNFSYTPKKANSEKINLTICTMKPAFIQPAGSSKWILNSPREKQYMAGFQRELSGSIDQILLSKGVKVEGPYESYEEMTFPERERCSYLLKPTFLVDIDAMAAGPLVEQLTYGGPNLEKFAYATRPIKLVGSVQMEYLIHDSLTYAKLEKHKLQTVEIQTQYTAFYQGTYNKHHDAENFQEIIYFMGSEADMSIREYNSNYPNADNASARILEELFSTFLPKVDELLSVDEFNHLLQYLNQLRGKKIY